MIIMKKILLVILIFGILIVSGCSSINEAIDNCDYITKYKTVNEKNCEYTSGCECVGKSWAGIGSCNSCRCEYQEKVC